MDFPIKNGDFPLPNVSSPEGILVSKVSKPFQSSKMPQGLAWHGAHDDLGQWFLPDQRRDTLLLKISWIHWIKGTSTGNPWKPGTHISGGKNNYGFP